MDTASIADRVRAAYRRGSEAVGEVVAQSVGELAAQMERLVARIVGVEAENAGLTTQLEALGGESAGLRAENAALRARLATNSRNSSQPPSADGPGVKPHPKSQRVTSGRKPGGQPGHVGHSLRLVEDPDAVVVHAPQHCSVCQQDLADVAVVR